MLLLCDPLVQHHVLQSWGDIAGDLLVDLSLFVRIRRDQHGGEGHLEEYLKLVLVAEDLEMNLLFEGLLSQEHLHTRLVLGVVVDVHLVDHEVVDECAVRSLVRGVGCEPMEAHVLLHKVAKDHESEFECKVGLHLLAKWREVLSTHVEDHLYELLAAEAPSAVQLVSED